LGDFSAFNKLKITNSFYRHKDIHKFTWEARWTVSIIDYEIINDRLKSNIKDTRVFRRSEIDSDHKLVESKFKFFTHAKHSHIKMDKTIYKKTPAFKVHLLEQESIRTLYRNRLKGKLTPLTGEIDVDWLKIKEAITKAAEESIGYKKWKNRRWLRMWNDDTQRAIEENKSSHRTYLQHKTVEHYIEYKRHRALVRIMTRRQRIGDWNKFVKILERDLTGTQRPDFKIFKQLQLHERDKLKIDPIPNTEWKEYYGKLCNVQGSKGEGGKKEERRSEGTDDNRDIITIEELNEVLKHAKKNRKIVD